MMGSTVFSILWHTVSVFRVHSFTGIYRDIGHIFIFWGGNVDVEL